MLYTVIIKKKVIVEADCADEAQELADDGNTICEEEEIKSIREISQSERIWFGLHEKN